MRVDYWSNTGFANRLRRMFGIVDQPSSGTLEEWAEYENAAMSTSKFGYKAVEGLNSLQNLFLYIPDKIRAITYYFSNIKNQSHVLRTQTKRGSWGDLTSRIPDALMLSIIDFVEKECFWMDIAWSDVTIFQPSAEAINKYKNQSYLMRKLFPIEIPDTVRAKYGFAWLDFQINSSATTKRQIERHKYQKIKAAYIFAKGRFQTFDAHKESGLDEFYKGYNLDFTMTPEKSRAFGKARELEAQFEKELTKHCTAIVRYRDYLWT